MSPRSGHARRSVLNQRRGPIRWFASLVVVVATVLVLTSCSFLNLGHLGFLLDDANGQTARARMATIVNALNDQDAGALRAMFTRYARTNYSAEIDEGVKYLLSMFPDRDVVWRDPNNGESSDGLENYGKSTTLVPSSYDVSAGGKVYSFYFADFEENENDPKNVGIYLMGAVLKTASEDSGPEAAFDTWARTVDVEARHGGPPGIFIPDDGQLTHQTMARIMTALNNHDAAALKGMFTESARTKHSAYIDNGLKQLFSYFPHGDIVWDQDHGGSGVDRRIKGDKKTVFLPSFYRITSGGVDYRFFFADFAENTIDPTEVGIYAMGVVPTAAARQDVPEAELYPWAKSFDVAASGPPGIFVPLEFTADSRMTQIAAAVNSHDAGALKGMFSSYALAHTSKIDTGLNHLLSLFPNGGITWTRDTTDTLPLASYSTGKSGKIVENMNANYKVSAGGKDYRLFFADFIADEVDSPENIGLEKLGVMPWIREPSDGCFELFPHSWACGPNLEGSGTNGYPVIYVPR